MCFLLRLFSNTEAYDFSMWQGYQIPASFIFATVCFLYNYHLKNTLICLSVVFLWVLSSLCKLKVGAILSEREIIQLISLSTIIYALTASLIYAVLGYFPKRLSAFLKALLLLIFSCFSLIPLLGLGYFVASGGHLISSHILLALFQTNFSEAKSYLSEQNLILWFWGFFLIPSVIVSLIYSINTLKIEKKHFKKCIISIFLSLVFMLLLVPKTSVSTIVQMLISTYKTLQEYKTFNAVIVQRKNILEKLNVSHLRNLEKQLHVLVIGESTVKDHMSAYGYTKKNTPWLSSKIKNDNNTIIFKNVYSNNILTTMSIQYALTEQNQFRKIALAESYTIFDIANSAGFETYWISNQEQFGLYSSPIKPIAYTAKNTIFINDHTSKRGLSTYYDEELVKYFPNILNRKAFIIFHLMGCHSVYRDRFPSSFKTFKNEKNDKIAEYDNCVLYNDYVLSLLYQKTQQNPNFSSFVYISDHGEEVEKGYAHDISKFTWHMPRIPFFMIFSQKYATENSNMIKTLKNHMHSYWTSDFLYEVMISILGLKNVPNYQEKFDLSSSNYHLKKEDLTIIDGLYHITDDSLE